MRKRPDRHAIRAPCVTIARQPPWKFKKRLRPLTGASASSPDFQANALVRRRFGYDRLAGLVTPESAQPSHS